MADIRQPLRAEARPSVREPVRPDGWPEGFKFYEPSHNKFDVDLSKKPDGMSYEWHAVTILGEVNHQQLVNWERNLWTPVPASRHPEVGGEPIPKDHKYASSGGILVEGQMLFERPQAVTDYARKIQRKEASDQVRNQFERLKVAPEGTLSDGGRRETKLNRSYERTVGPAQTADEDK